MSPPVVVAVVGAGPRGLAILERLASNAPELAASRELEIHLIDPFPAGGGRIWRQDQPVELLMNTLADEVTLYVDGSVRCQGPLRDGPTLLEWAQERARDHTVDDARRARYAEIEHGRAASRRIQAEYLAAVLDDVRAGLPPSVTVRFHTATATDLEEGPSGRQRVTLTDGERLDADAVVLTIGHLDVAPDAHGERLSRAAEQAGLRYVPPQHTAEADLSFVRPGEAILMRGLGLAFVDLVALLFEGRGGRFHPAADGRLVYEPHGGEPHLLVGSRRGVPYQAKPAQRLRGERPPLPRFFTAAALARLLREHPRVDMWDHVRPLVEKEISWGYYHELFNGHPERVGLSWEEFAPRYAETDGDDLHELVAGAVAPDDVLDLHGRDRPLDGVRFSSLDKLQAHLQDHMGRGVLRSTDPAHSAESGAMHAFLSVFSAMGLLWHSGRLNARSQTAGLAWWRGHFDHFTSGPPPYRLRQLHALAEAGFLRFVGAEMWVEVDERAGLFRAGSSTTPETVTAPTLVEARLAVPDLARVRDPLLQALAARGEISEERVDDGAEELGTGLVRVTASDARLIDTTGRAHPARFALGPFTTLRASAGFYRPGTGSASIRQNDLVARTALTAACRSDQPARTA